MGAHSNLHCDIQAGVGHTMVTAGEWCCSGDDFLQIDTHPPECYDMKYKRIDIFTPASFSELPSEMDVMSVVWQFRDASGVQTSSIDTGLRFLTRKIEPDNRARYVFA